MALPKIDIDAVNSSITELPKQVSNEQPTSFTEAYVSLILVLGFIIFLAWLLKKLGKTTRFKRSKHLDIVDSISVGTKERVFIIKQNDRLLTIGVTQHSINLLNSELIKDEQLLSTEDESASIAPSSSFKSKLDFLLNKKS